MAPDDREDDADLDVAAWRYDQARRLGVPADDATTFANGAADIGELRRLIETLGCDPHVAATIVV